MSSTFKDLYSSTVSLYGPFLRWRDNLHRQTWVPVRSLKGEIGALITFCHVKYFQVFLFQLEAVFMSSPGVFHCRVCRHGIFSKMNPCAQVFSPSHLLFPADFQSWKNSCLHGLAVALQGPTWAPFGLSWPLLMSLSLILLPPAGQMFICEAADKGKKNLPILTEVQRERSQPRVTHLKVFSQWSETVDSSRSGSHGA